jgi:hypothetical protein
VEKKCFLSSAQHSYLMMVHSWLLFVHTLECNEKLFVLHPLTLIYFTRQNFTQKKNKMKKEWIEFEIQLCTHASERAQGVEGTCTQASQAWSPLVWSQSSSPASDWSCEGLSNTQNWCTRLLLFLHPSAISFFCPPTACCLLPCN